MSVNLAGRPAPRSYFPIVLSTRTGRPGENDRTQRPPHDADLTSEVGLRPGVDAMPNAAGTKKLPYQYLGRTSRRRRLLTRERTESDEAPGLLLNDPPAAGPSVTVRGCHQYSRLALGVGWTTVMTGFDFHCRTGHLGGRRPPTSKARTIRQTFHHPSARIRVTTGWLHAPGP